MMTSQLPHDILQEIVDTVAGDGDYRTLFSLSSTCKTILPMCRAHIFRTMTLVPRDWDYLSNESTPESYRLGSLLRNRQIFRVKIAIDLVNSSPDILDYVRSLHLQSHQSNYNDLAYLDLLSKFSRLSELTITACEYVQQQGADLHMHMPRWTWERFPRAYQAALAQLVRRSPIQSLSIEYAGNVPLAVLVPCVDLKVLTLLCTTFASSGRDFGGAQLFVPLDVRELYFKYDMGAALSLLDNSDGSSTVINPAALETVAFALHSASVNGRENRALKGAEALEELFMSDPEIDSYTNFLSDVLDNMHPNAYTTLSFLRITITYTTAVHPKPVPSTILYGRRFQCLERLEILLDIEAAEYETAISEDLAVLDSVLSSPHYLTLRLLRIDCMANYILTEESSWDSIAGAQFPKIATENPTLLFDYGTFHDLNDYGDEERTSDGDSELELE